MELGSFGAIIQFAIRLEEEAAALHLRGAQLLPSEVARKLLSEFGSEGARSKRRLERVRRQQVNEMLLARVTGLTTSTYQVPDLVGAADESSAISAAVQAEEVLARFYEEAAARLPLPDVVRSFQQLARDHADRAQRIRELRQPGPGL